MRLVGYFSGILVMLGIVLGCVNTRQNASTDGSKFGKITENKLLGVYKGDLPCADCEAIATVLILEPDNQYKLEYVYVGKDIDAFSKQGKWSLEEDELGLEGIDYRYKVEQGQLRQLDLSGSEIKGNLAERYVLKLLQ